MDVVRFFTKLKMELLPYLYSSAAETSRTGVPVMRSMVLEFERDPACQYLDRQYMLGEKLLVAPIFNDRSEASYYLPAGKWTNFFHRRKIRRCCMEKRKARLSLHSAVGA